MAGFLFKREMISQLLFVFKEFVEHKQFSHVHLILFFIFWIPAKPKTATLILVSFVFFFLIIEEHNNHLGLFTFYNFNDIMYLSSLE
jgi:hypothetical protein